MSTLPARVLRAAALAICTALVCPAATVLGQETAEQKPGDAALRVFFDCQGGCDFSFIRQEIEYINWVRDRLVAQVHVLVTRQGTGGGVEYQLQFIGLERFEGQEQVLLFNSSQTDTDDERRRGLARILTLGLARYIAQTPLAAYAELVLRTPDGGARQVLSTSAADDPWNFWVFSVGIDGSARGEQRTSREAFSLSGRASRVTEEWKLLLDGEFDYIESRFEFDDGSEFRDVFRDLDAGGQVVKTLGEHWGAGAGASVRDSTFFNLSPSYRVAGALEYNIYPYVESSQRRLTFTYFFAGNQFNYREETIFGETQETLPEQGLIASLDLERPWGSASVDLEAAHFLRQPGEFNVELDGNLEYRILRGLSLDMFGGIESIQVQRYLPATGATDEEILLERRALATDFRFYIGVGIRYTFGSIFNNVVNARLGGNARGFHTIF